MHKTRVLSYFFCTRECSRYTVSTLWLILALRSVYALHISCRHIYHIGPQSLLHALHVGLGLLSTTSKMASSTTSSSASAKRPGCNISTAMCSSRTKRATKQHVDHKIANALLKKKGTRDAYRAWNQQDLAFCVGSTYACTSRTTRADSASPTTPSQGTLRRTTNARCVAFVRTAL
jgi:hypothetical protein